jgi:hypothetical protein
MRVVHEEERGAVVGAEVAGGDVLAVAGDVGVGERAVVEDLEEAGGAAAELDVRPAGLADGGDVEAVAGGDELFSNSPKVSLAGPRSVRFSLAGRLPISRWTALMLSVKARVEN